MSQRVMKCVKSFVPETEVYSIDECFLDFSSFKHYDLIQKSLEIRQKIKQWTGIPVGIGIGPTKTLAKIANFCAKKFVHNGVFLIDDFNKNEILKVFPVEEIWGIGRQYAAKLKSFGINTALELMEANLAFIRQHFTVVGERMVYELRGVSCIPLNPPVVKKGICSSKSFGYSLTEEKDIAEALSDYVARAAFKLRQQQSRARGLEVFLMTNRFQVKKGQYANSMKYHLTVPTCATSELIKIAKNCLAQIFKPGYEYHKTGINLFDLVHESQVQQHLFLDAVNHKSERVSKLVDQINQKFGKKEVFWAAQGIEKAWQMKRSRCTPHYTTNWKQLPVVNCEKNA